MARAFKKPTLPGSALFESQSASADPAEHSAAGHRIANLLVRGPHDDSDGELVERVLHLVDNEGLAVVAELWAHASGESVAGVLWRLYLLRTWVQRNPEQAAREFGAGRIYAPVQELLAGMTDPPGPAEVSTLLDTLVRGIVTTDFDVVIDRAAAFAHIAGVGRAQLDEGDERSAARLVDMARVLRRAAEHERRGTLY
jgi:hypothetical protein